MQLAIWDTPPADFFLAGLKASEAAEEVDVQRASARACEEALRSGAVDVALLPTVRALQFVDDYDVLPAVALSSWKYPYARLVLKNGLGGGVDQVVCHPDNVQEALIARVVLKEHYDLEPDLVGREADPRTLLASEQEGALLVGDDVYAIETDFLMMDLGREWYELANYPMVWGVFATRKEEGDPEMIEPLRQAAEAAEEQRSAWLEKQDLPEEPHAFFAEELRLRLGRLATASMTELRHYLFYYDLTDEVPDVPFLYVPDEENSGDQDEILL